MLPGLISHACRLELVFSRHPGDGKYKQYQHFEACLHFLALKC